MNGLLAHYTNGNAIVMTGKDGSRIRLNQGKYKPEFPEFVELKITKRCDLSCPYCYDHAKPDGLHGDILNDAVINSIPDGIDVEISGGNPLTHPNLAELVTRLHSKGCPVTICLHQRHFMLNYDALTFMCENDFIKEVDVSMEEPTDEFIDAVSRMEKAFVSVIAGIVTKTALKKLYDKNISLKIRGYKRFRRGATYYSGDTSVLIDTNIQSLKSSFGSLLSHFKCVDIDTSAKKQIIGSDSIFNDAMGAIGDIDQYCMFIDAVGKKYGASPELDLSLYDPTQDTLSDIYKKLSGG